MVESAPVVLLLQLGLYQRREARKSLFVAACVPIGDNWTIELNIIQEYVDLLRHRPQMTYMSKYIKYTKNPCQKHLHDVHEKCRNCAYN